MKTEEQIENYLASLTESLKSIEYTLEHGKLEGATYIELFNEAEVIQGITTALNWVLLED